MGWGGVGWGGGEGGGGEHYAVHKISVISNDNLEKSCATMLLIFRLYCEDLSHDLSFLDPALSSIFANYEDQNAKKKKKKKESTEYSVIAGKPI